MNYTIPEIPHLKLRFFLESRSSTELRPVKGSMLRGVFGHALKRTVCAMERETACEGCMLRRQCVYTRIFETFVEGDPPPFMKGLKTSPRPFIIDAADTRTQFNKGDVLTFDLTLLGSAADQHPYVIFGFAKACEMGLTPKRYPFQLVRVDWLNGNWNLLYDGKKESLQSKAGPALIPQNAALTGPVTFKFLTPTRLKVKNQLTMDFNFRLLVHKMLRRTLEIAHFHVPESRPDWAFHDFLVRANDVAIVDKKLYWDDWSRYSNRQQSKLDMGGFFGEMTLEGDLAPFGPLLRTSEVLHVGKGTVFGNGKVRIETKRN